jgi:uncharacterized protein with ATP-grasp and redox domains
MPTFTSVLDVRYGRDPGLDAWLLHFMAENNLEYVIDPDKNASPEQIRFQVMLADDQFYAPCGDWMLLHLLNRWYEPDVRLEYNRKWKSLIKLVQANVPDRTLRKKIIGLCRYKLCQAHAQPILIPSRLMKRLITMFMTLSGQADPYRERRALANERALRVTHSPLMDNLINACPDTAPACRNLADLRYELSVLELTRLLILSTQGLIWRLDGYVPTGEDFKHEISRTLENFDPVRRIFGAESGQPMKILFLPDSSGGLMFDLLAIRCLLRQGHSVTLALKEGFYFDCPTFWDWETDPALAQALEGAHFLADHETSKNELLRVQRENRLVVISDGTREEPNFYRTSVTFARAFKEADLILAKGVPYYRRMIQTSHEFTRDIIVFFRDDVGRFQLHCKPRSDKVRKFTEKDLRRRADSIITEMRRARSEGRTVMFYSAIIGSIPGQTATALRILNVFVDYLRTRLDKTYIVNPAEHFAEGMDGDDLMYMWEKVQRSGYIDVWRFQSVTDIEKSFELLGEKVPSFWTGKDATFSTGCTKEMRIALDMQSRYRELQILGPSPEKFFRRREYGVGKYCDSSIECH